MPVLSLGLVLNSGVLKLEASYSTVQTSKRWATVENGQRTGRFVGQRGIMSM